MNLWKLRSVAPLAATASLVLGMMVMGTSVASAADPMGVDDGTQLTLWTRAATQVRVDALPDREGHASRALLEGLAAVEELLAGKGFGPAAKGEAAK